MYGGSIKLDTPIKPIFNSELSNLFVIFNCKTYSLEHPRKFNIPHQYTRMMMTILIKYLKFGCDFNRFITLVNCVNVELLANELRIHSNSILSLL